MPVLVIATIFGVIDFFSLVISFALVVVLVLAIVAVIYLAILHNHEGPAQANPPPQTS